MLCPWPWQRVMTCFRTSARCADLDISVTSDPAWLHTWQTHHLTLVSLIRMAMPLWIYLLPSAGASEFVLYVRQNSQIKVI